MAYLNVKERVIEAKIVYYGAGLSGKTTNLEKVKEHATDGKAGDLMTLETDGDRTLFFDWLPFNIGKFNGCDVKMQLYTVPGQARYAETRKRVLSSADGVVLVLDSQSAALAKNRDCVKDLMEHLRANGLSEEIPLVVQLNKRDLPTAMPADVLLRETGLDGRPHVLASAARSEGVFETLREITRVVLQSVRDQARSRAPELKRGAKSGLDGDSLYAAVANTEGATAVPTDGDRAEPASSVPSSGKNAPRDKNTVNGAGPGAAAAPQAGATVPRSLAPTEGAPRASDSVGASKPAPPSVTRAPTSGSPPASSMPVSARSLDESGAATRAQINEAIAGQRTLARRLDQVEATVTKGIDRAVADAERRIMARLTEMLAAQTASAQVTSELGRALAELDRRLREEGPKRDSELRKGIEVEVGRRVDAATRSIPKLEEATASVADGVRTSAMLLRDLARMLDERANRSDAVIADVDARAGMRLNEVEFRLREITELYAQMMADSKKPKAWWR